MHNLTDDTGRLQARQMRQVYCAFGLTTAFEHPTWAGPERKHVPRACQVVWLTPGIDRGEDGTGAIRRRDTGTNTLTRVDRDRKGCGVARRIVLDHEGQGFTTGHFFGF